jgi:hypothetical protein
MVEVPITTMIPQNGRTVRLLGDISGCTPIYTNNKITSIACTGEDGPFSISVGDTIRPRPKSPYKINLIEKGLFNNQTVCYDLMVAALTDSSIFALPLLGGNRKLFMWDSLFVNAFIGTQTQTDCIVLLYRYSGDQLFLKFESALCSFRNFKERIDTDPHHVLFIFNVPEEAKPSYDSFKEGRFSEIDDMWKLKILDFHEFNTDGQTGQILFRSKFLKADLERSIGMKLPEGSELHSKPNLETEIYNEAHYKAASRII